MTIDQIIKEIDSKAMGRTRYIGQEPRWDETMVAEIRSLREAVRVLAKSSLTGNQLSEYAASSREDNTPEFVEGLKDECGEVQMLYRVAMANPIASAAVEAAKKGRPGD